MAGRNTTPHEETTRGRGAGRTSSRWGRGEVGGDWTSRARCRGTNHQDFFKRSLPEAREALKLCKGCVVQQDCLDYAVEHRIDVGVWGGLTERQRRAYARTIA